MGMRKPFMAMTAKLSSEEMASTQKALRSRLRQRKTKSSAYSAQIYHNISKEMDIGKIVAAGGVKPIVEWLTARLYRFGRLKPTAGLTRNVLCGEFDPTYYTDYLTAKFRELYKL